MMRNSGAVEDGPNTAMEVNKRLRAKLTTKTSSKWLTGHVSFHLTVLNNRQLYLPFALQIPCVVLSVLSFSLFKALLLKRENGALFL